jgi:hypothetical protein
MNIKLGLVQYFFDWFYLAVYHFFSKFKEIASLPYRKIKKNLVFPKFQ